MGQPSGVSLASRAVLMASAASAVTQPAQTSGLPFSHQTAVSLMLASLFSPRHLPTAWYYKDVYAHCASYGVLPLVSKRSNSGTGDGPIDRSSDRFKTLYRARASVEREFGRLKHHLALTPLRVRGLRKVQLHADLCLLTRLALATL